MNNLWIFGCSISDNTQPSQRRDYVKWKGYVIKTWSELLSEKIGYNLKNHAVSGSSNLNIMESFSKFCTNISGNDVVILNWTELSRFRVADKTWHHVLPAHISHEEMADELKKINNIGISTDTIKEIIFNRDHHLYQIEIENWTNLINDYCKLKKIKVIFWGLHSDNKFTKKINNTNLFNYILLKHGSIGTETNNQVQDGHFSEKSHIVASDMFYDLLKNTL